jgi:hypothetical protein
MNIDKKEKVDGVVTYMVLKKLLTPVVKTKAYKLGLVNHNGKILKEPETDEEKEALTILDKIMFKIKRLLGPKTSNLNIFLYLQSMEKDFTDNIVVMGNADQRTEVRRIKRDMERLIEKEIRENQRQLRG